MRAVVVFIGVAAAISKIAGQWVKRACLKLATQNVQSSHVNQQFNRRELNLHQSGVLSMPG
jgi:hypothetical protein